MRPSAATGFATALWPSRSLAIAEVDDGARIVTANGPMAELADGDISGRPFAALVVPAQRPAVEAFLIAVGPEWAGMTAGFAPDETGVPVDYEVWARREHARVLVVAEPNTAGVAALNAQLLNLNDELIAARRVAARLAASEGAARARAEATALQLRNVQQIVDTGLADLSLDDLLEVLLGRLRDAVRADAIEALLVDESGSFLEVRADLGLPDRQPGDVTFATTEGLAGQTLREGRMLELRQVTADAGVSRAMAATASSLVAVPLQGGGRPLGVLMLGASDEERAVEPADIEMLELAAERLGTAIDRALAFDRERRIASVLQTSLMPGPLPDVPGLSVATRYRPAGVGHRVGGDFYDVFATVGDRYVAMVGDVRGKGPEAAARTALVRFTARALARREPSPAALLGELNRAMLEEGGRDHRHCSVVYAAFEHAGADDTMTVELASGGHPPPLVLREGGAVESIELPGSLVGLFSEAEHRDMRIDLADGDLMLFYTDGVTEARRNGELYGEERLAGLLGGCRGMQPDEVADRVESAVEEYTEGPLMDDLAIVAVRVVPRER